MAAGALGVAALVAVVFVVWLVRRAPGSVRLTASWDVHLRTQVDPPEEPAEPEPPDDASGAT